MDFSGPNFLLSEDVKQIKKAINVIVVIKIIILVTTGSHFSIILHQTPPLYLQETFK